MKKITLSAFLAASVAVSAVSPALVGAFGGTYPKSEGYAGMQEQGNTTRPSYSQTNPDYLFSVGGKNFILLDTDKDGNYFVMTDDLYGKHTYDTTYSGKVTIATMQNNNIVKGPAYEIKDSEWTFDIADSDNIGYWLNNDFWNNGNGTGNILPQEIKDNVIETEWTVEGMKAVRGWTSNNFFDALYKTTTAIDFANSRVVEPYKTTGKIALMSFTEFNKYIDIIGFTHDEDVWRGFMLRTPHAMTSAKTTNETNTVITYTWGGGMAKNNSAKGVTPVKNMVTCVNDTPDTKNMFVRPVMWLSKDFFKNVKIDLESAGDIAIEEIKKLSLKDILNIYSVDEAASLYEDVTNAPQIENLSIAGTPVIGSVIVPDYDFVPYQNAAEGSSDIYWFTSDTADGDFVISEVTGDKFYPDTAGKFIKCCIIPKDVNSKSGKMYITDAIGAVTEAKTVSLSDMSVTEEAVSVKINNTFTDKKSVRLISAVYDKDNQLISVTNETVEIPSGETEKSISFLKGSQGQTVSVMIWADDNQPLFLINK